MLDVLISGFINGNSYVLIALGLSLIFGVANLVNFAHGSIFAIGSMVGWWFVAVLNWPLWATLLGTIAITALLGLIIEFICVRPLSSAPPIATLLSTLAAAFVLDYSSQLIFSTNTRRFPSLLPTDNILVAGIRLRGHYVAIATLGTSAMISAALLSFQGITYYLLCLTILLLVIALVTRLQRSHLGRGWYAIREDETAAQSSGVPLFLLDEPTAGMNPTETAEVLEQLLQLRAQGQTLLLVEHKLDLVMKLSDHILVMDGGKLIAQGTPDEIQTNERVIEAYLGRRRSLAKQT